ncbi:CoaE-domain-containing protein [Conidiobolus coronatus NRRL 28638]|uniref:CoaE-domain-containing protein n=1 Tax=Conidiobolus coronatus (strain ATCC 28846 / CBS 209.66 / NRRL 28638) TaxID=796925 RepID=A0A137NU03_CONC2|nr:CoaE-domain-containing protein [Conidiobolus coronatus NRRL 28638]|eukprot:KXN66222.1 CoaE-domain-containing protein [Conidiobolus coronatus NRRL 28638]
MKIIGLTGGISTGKSTVSKELQILGLPLIDCDLLARVVVEPGKPAIKQIEKQFGKEYINEDGTLNREKLGDFIFKNPAQRRQLNKITHWYIRLEIAKSLINMVVIDAPLLIEAGIHLFVSELWVVYTDAPTQLERLIARNGFTEEDAKNRINSQLSLETKKDMATRVIDNNGTVEKTKLQVETIVKESMPWKITTWAWIVLPPLVIVTVSIVMFKLLMKFLILPIYNEVITYF